MLRGLGILMASNRRISGDTVWASMQLWLRRTHALFRALKAVQTRGRLMQEATPVGSGAMAP
jgi:hypothetical protein